ncbi:MAG: MOSC domain-containing protein [Actinomycetota bacterium]|nr:MOSC domain-containing protein [Actinomycetota bacterium]
MAHLLSVNLGVVRPSRVRREMPTAIDKHAYDGPVDVRAPGDRATGLGSGLVGDHIGDPRHHGGDGQAVYAFAREELDSWESRLDRPLRNGMFGENLTTTGIEVSEAVIGERWQVGDTVVLQVTGPRIPCGRFRAHMGERGWLKTFTTAARSGAYLSVVTPGRVASADPVAVVHRPDHGVTAMLAFRALTREPELLPSLLDAGADLVDELRAMAEEGRTYSIG